MRPEISEKISNKHWFQWFGMLLGPLLAGVFLAALPREYEILASDGTRTLAEFSWEGRATLGVMVWMGVWWLTEAIHISATALLPIVLFPLLGATDLQSATFQYANPLIFLYFGGFVLALAMERWGLGKRIALLTLRTVGTTARRMVAGFMLVTAVLSAFVSNTATTAMMLPIALSVVALMRGQQSAGSSVDDEARREIGNQAGSEETSEDEQVDQFGTCLLLAIAYSASIGGVMTIIGTPTNTFLVGFLRENIAAEYRTNFSFAGWMPIGVSLAAVFLPITYFVLTRFLFPVGTMCLAGGKQLIERELTKLGGVHRGEKITLGVFLVTVALWLFRPLVTQIQIPWDGAVLRPFAALTDTGVAMLAAMALFVLPVDFRRRQFAMDWKTANKMPWGILLLFGGGLSLAAAVQANGVAEFIGSFTSRIGGLPTIVTVLAVTTVIIFMTELTSNAATTASLVPVLAAVAPGVGVHPLLLVIPATVAASCAFMLPVATPPNAIVFGSGAIALPQMVRAGFVLNVIAIFVVTAVAMLVVKPWLGI